MATCRPNMLPVLILQHLSADGPAYLSTWLARTGRRVDVFDTQRGEAYPQRIDGYGALAVLGGEMSANDPLPSLRQAEQLILQALGAGLPVLGHCLGGQLMARALGAEVRKSPQPEIGWQPMRVVDSKAAREWFGRSGEHTVFHWHNEAFELPKGATALATSPACPHQAFALGARQLAMQFHVELDLAKLSVWARSRDPGYLQQQIDHPRTVQSGEAMLEQAQGALPEQHKLADHIYGRWLDGAA